MLNKTNKIVAILLIFTLTFANWSMLGTAIAKSVEDNLEMQGTNTNIANVKFDAYFEENNAKTHTANGQMGTETVLNLDVEVKNAGYLKNAYIDLSEIEKYYEIDSKEIDKLQIKQVNVGELLKLTVNLALNANETELAKLHNISGIILRGTYVGKDGKEQKVEKEVKVEINWQDEQKVKVEEEYIRYEDYEKEERKGSILQSKITVSREGGGHLPVEETKVIVKVPEIEGKKIEKVRVNTINIGLTKGSKLEDVEFNETDWEYNEESKEIRITVKNEAKDGKAYNGEGEDEYLITYIYEEEKGEEVIITVGGEAPEEEKITSDIEVRIKEYNKEEEIKGSIKEEKEVVKTESRQNIEIYTDVEKINKGKMYANQITEGNKYETKYETKVVINIPYAEIEKDVLVINMPEDKLYDKEGNKIEKEGITYYKTIKISKANFEEILGEEGTIRIYNGTEEIGRIDKTSKEDEAGNLCVEYNKSNEKEEEVRIYEGITIDTNYTEKTEERNNGEQKYTNLKIEISKPEKEGNLIIVNEKEINEETKYTNEEITRAAGIETIANEAKAEIELEETESKITVEVDREEITSIAKNKDVTITVSLNNKEENTNLYKNPIIDIVLPEEVEEIEIKQADLIYAEGLEIKEIQQGVVEGRKAIRAIIEGTQEEFSNGVLTEGTNLIIKADIGLKEMSPNVEREIRAYCKNENEIAKELGMSRLGGAVGVGITAPEEVISISTIKEDDEGKEVTGIKSEKQTGKIEILEEAKTKEMELKILNNCANEITNIKILGRIPSEGNKTPEGIELGSNFNTTLKTAVENQIEGAKIYYSEDANARKEVDSTWKTEEEIDISKAKSYLIVLPEDYKLEGSESLGFAYNFEIPEMLEHNSQSYGTFTTYYTREDGEAKINETSLSEIVGVSTGEGPQLKVELTANVENESIVRNAQIVMYTVKVTNTGKNVVKNALVTVPIPEYTNYVEFDGEKYIVGAGQEKEFTIESINAGETKTYAFYIKVKSLPTLEEYYYNVKKDEKGYYTEKTERIELIEISKEKAEELEKDGIPYIKNNEEKYYYSEYKVNGEYYLEEMVKNGDSVKIDNDGSHYIETTIKEYVKEYIPIITNATIKADGLSKNITSNTIELKGVKSEVSINTNTHIISASNTIRENDEIQYTISITNISEKALNNIVFNMDYSDALQYKEAYVINRNKEKTQLVDAYNNNKIQYNISSLSVGENIQLKILGNAKSLGNEYEKEITTTSKVTVNNTTYTSDPMINKIARAKLEANQISSAHNSYIKEGDIYTYELTVNNNGSISTDELNVEVNIPNELIVRDMYYVIEENKIGMAKLNKQQLSMVVNPEQALKIVAQVEVNKLKGELTEKQITNSFKITEAGREIPVNSISHTIEENPNYKGPDMYVPDNQEQPNNPDNSNSLADKTYKISGKVWLDENNNGKYENGEKLFKDIEVFLINEKGETLQTTITNSEGTYTFTNLNSGKYIVAFKYDSNTYSLTYYEKDGVDESINSNVIGDKGTAITDTIEITNTSIGNINAGLTTKETFDLKLDKYVSKITVQTSSGTKTYEQKDKTTLAKTDIRAKELKGARVIMEYKIVITNEGKTAGYAKEVVDYIPNDTVFSSELNSGWYLGNDKNLHTTQLKDLLIEPGESKTISVVLTRNMTETNTDTVNNRAEILKSESIEQAEDVDSVGGNKVSTEDDIASADIIIGVATGREVVYITIGVASMIILGTGIYFIKKKVLV